MQDVDRKTNRLYDSLISQSRCQQIQLGPNKVWKPSAEFLAPADTDRSQASTPAGVMWVLSRSLYQEGTPTHGHPLQFLYVTSDTQATRRALGQETCAGVTAEPGVKDRQSLERGQQVGCPEDWKALKSWGWLVSLWGKQSKRCKVTNWERKQEVRNKPQKIENTLGFHQCGKG